MKEGELALVPKGLKLPKTHAYVVEYDSNDFLCDYFDLDASQLNYKEAFLQDALLSLAVTKVLFDETNYARLNTFQRDAHRQEEFTDAQGRLWVNDSKATNLDATIQAIKGYADREIHLILGGDDKGVDLTPLFEAMQGLTLTLYTIGANNDKLLTLANTYNIDAVEAKHIETAITQIDKKLHKENVALLSPAAASFDQFNSYKHRGETFMVLVKRLNS
jgi:UDP-N-acetylmuramoylalanine--D-glutamate ligase